MTRLTLLPFQTLSNQPQVGTEFYACINVLRQAGYPQQALALARLTKNSSDCIQILIEDLKDSSAVIREINSLQFDQVIVAFFDFCPQDHVFSQRFYLRWNLVGLPLKPVCNTIFYLHSAFTTSGYLGL